MCVFFCPSTKVDRLCCVAMADVVASGSISSGKNFCPPHSPPEMMMMTMGRREQREHSPLVDRPINNISIVLQPSLFNLDSGRELPQQRRIHVLPTEIQSNDESLRKKYAQVGIYLNGKLARAKLLAQDDHDDEVSRERERDAGLGLDTKIKIIVEQTIYIYDVVALL